MVLLVLLVLLMLLVQLVLLMLLQGVFSQTTLCCLSLATVLLLLFPLRSLLLLAAALCLRHQHPPGFSPAHQEALVRLKQHPKEPQHAAQAHNVGQQLRYLHLWREHREGIGRDQGQSNCEAHARSRWRQRQVAIVIALCAQRRPQC